MPIEGASCGGAVALQGHAGEESTRPRENTRALLGLNGRLGTDPDRSKLVVLAAQLILKEALEGEVRDEIGRERYERSEAEASSYHTGFSAPVSLDRAHQRLIFGPPTVVGNLL
jgi:hypothetical protein